MGWREQRWVSASCACLVLPLQTGAWLTDSSAGGTAPVNFLKKLWTLNKCSEPESTARRHTTGHPLVPLTQCQLAAKSVHLVLYPKVPNTVCACARACVCVCWGRVVGEELPGIISRKSQTSQVRIFNHPTIIVPKKMGNNSLIFSNSDCIQLFLFTSRVVFFSSHNWFNQIRIQTGSTYYIWFISLLSVF